MLQTRQPEGVAGSLRAARTGDDLPTGTRHGLETGVPQAVFRRGRTPTALFVL
jgi:hypothetical protein